MTMPLILTNPAIGFVVKEVSSGPKHVTKVYGYNAHETVNNTGHLFQNGGSISGICTVCGDSITQHPAAWVSQTAEYAATVMLATVVNPDGTISATGVKVGTSMVYGQDFALYTSTGQYVEPYIDAHGEYLLAIKVPETSPTAHETNAHIYHESGMWFKKTFYSDWTTKVEQVKGPLTFPTSLQSTWPVDEAGAFKNPMTETVDPRTGHLEQDGSGGWRRRPRGKTLFDIRDMPREKWAYCVERRRLWTATGSDGEETRVWRDYHRPVDKRPYGFLTRAAALRRMMDLMREDRHNIADGLVEYRVSPQYLGYLPDGEEWYSQGYVSVEDKLKIKGPLLSTESTE
jgi:hypothetical protein